MLGNVNINNLKRYLSGENPSFEEQALGEIIAEHKLERDWPEGLNERNKYLYGIEDGLPIRIKPENDREYQLILLKQVIEVPIMPPKYYRGYQKWFNTQTWQDMQKWPEYIEKAIKFERMENIINRIRRENYAKEKAMLEIEAKKHLASAYVKYKLNKDFLIDFNSKESQESIPNAIMLESNDREENINNLKWLVGKANTNYVHIEDDCTKDTVRVNQIITALETAQENYIKNGKRTLLWVDHFDKLLVHNEENDETISDLKDLLCKLSKEYKTTLIFETDNSKKMDPIALQSHRVKIKINMNKDISLKELKELQNEFLRANIKVIPGTDCYRFTYLPTDKDFVDLYLGSFGHDSSVLWIDSQDNEKIKVVLDNVEVLKSIPKFNNIQKIQCPRPNKFDGIGDMLNNTYLLTKEGQVIYEYKIKNPK